MFTKRIKEKIKGYSRSRGLVGLFSLTLVLTGFTPLVIAADNAGTLNSFFTPGINEIEGNLTSEFEVDLNDQLPVWIEITPGTFGEEYFITINNDFILTSLNLRWDQDNINTTSAPTDLVDLGFNDLGTPNDGAVVSSVSSGADFHEISLNFPDGGLGGFTIGSMEFDIVWNDFNANNDYSLHIDANELDPIPLPAAVWFFGTGLVGLMAVSRRRKG